MILYTYVRKLANIPQSVDIDYKAHKNNAHPIQIKQVFAPLYT